MSRLELLLFKVPWKKDCFVSGQHFLAKKCTCLNSSQNLQTSVTKLQITDSKSQETRVSLYTNTGVCSLLQLHDMSLCMCFGAQHPGWQGRNVPYTPALLCLLSEIGVIDDYNIAIDAIPQSLGSITLLDALSPSPKAVQQMALTLPKMDNL